MTAPSRAARRAAAALALPAAAGAAVLARELYRVRVEIGAPASRLRAAAVRSGAAPGGRFRNSEPSTAFDLSRARDGIAQMRGRGARGAPARPVPVLPVDGDGAAPLGATWLGHATVLFEIDGARVLVDPVFGERCSPSRWIGPRRLHRPPVDAAGLPPIDAVLISHDHYDHLERATMLALARRHACTIVVPTGIAAHLRGWGVPAGRIVELGWGGEATVAGLRVVCAEVRHFSGRGLRRDGTQWAGWCVLGPRHRAYFGGDSGYTAAFAATGRWHGPFDLTVLPVGAYSTMWPDVHMTPEEAVRACADLNPGSGAPLLLPVHWATFDLAPHDWAEPVERLLAAAGAGARVLTPVPGQRVIVAADGTADGVADGAEAAMVRWWRTRDGAASGDAG